LFGFGAGAVQPTPMTHRKRIMQPNEKHGRDALCDSEKERENAWFMYLTG